MTGRHPVWQLLDRLQMDIRAMDGKLTELRSLVAGLKLEAVNPASQQRLCPLCGIGAKHAGHPACCGPFHLLEGCLLLAEQGGEARAPHPNPGKETAA